MKLSIDRVLKHTRSRCPACKAEIAATIVERGGRVLMEKACPEHGEFRVQLQSDARWHFLSEGDRSGGHAGPDFERLSTCVALIEIVETCNLTCPTCYAGSPHGVGDDLRCAPFEDVVRRVDAVCARKGTIDILQLSGGEPTIHPEFERILRWATAHPSVGYVLVNTNAVRIAGDERFRAMLADVRRANPRFELYVQFDGVQEAGQAELRGADLRAMRERAIDLSGALGVPTTLAMVVDPRTIAGVGDTLRWAVARPHVRGISLQPVFTSGRIAPVESRTLPVYGAGSGAGGPAVVHALGVSDVVRACVTQAPELLAEADFTPLPCGDPNCHTIAYVLRTPDGPVGLSRLIDVPTYAGFLQNRVNYDLEDLARCGCETEPLGELLKSLELRPEHPLRIFIKPFMDAWTFDQDRIDRCCTHVIREDGSLDSFCRHYG
ncbi:MAG: radical SAM protein [Phycisphaerales bacterium]|nr:radical SAM protein [Phycisphaerales bacterium]